jgi:FixJ family two-component response regulator
MDVHLPLMNGLELRSQVAALQPDIHVVFITADHELANGEHREPRSVWLTKPVDEDTLLDAIARACSGEPAVVAARS